MMAQVEPFLEFDEDFILDQYDQTVAYYKKSGQKTRPWSFGKIYRSMTGVYVLGGRKTRTPVGFPVLITSFYRMTLTNKRAYTIRWTRKLASQPANRSGIRMSMCIHQLALELCFEDQE